MTNTKKLDHVAVALSQESPESTGCLRFCIILSIALRLPAKPVTSAKARIHIVIAQGIKISYNFLCKLSQNSPSVNVNGENGVNDVVITTAATYALILY